MQWKKDFYQFLEKVGRRKISLVENIGFAKDKHVTISFEKGKNKNIYVCLKFFTTHCFLEK